MTSSADPTAKPTRLDRTITWVGVGAVTALAALLLMFGARSFAQSEPNAENVGEEYISVIFGFFGWGTGLIVALVAGWALARRAERNKWWLRPLPLIVAIAWMLLARAALYGRWFERFTFTAFEQFAPLPSAQSRLLWPLFNQSVDSLGALPLGIGLFLAFLVLISVRSVRQVPEPVATAQTL